MVRNSSLECIAQRAFLPSSLTAGLRCAALSLMALAIAAEWRTRHGPSHSRRAAVNARMQALRWF